MVQLAMIASVAALGIGTGGASSIGSASAMVSLMHFIQALDFITSFRAVDWS